MTTERPAAFDASTVEATADEHELDADELESVIHRHQTFVGGHGGVGGVDGIVYEWRDAFPEDPVVAQTPDVYHLRLDAEVWEDFAARLDLTEAEFDALRAAHARQFRADSGADAPDDSGREPMVLTRT